MDVKVGRQVLFAKYAGTEFKLDDEELLIVSQKDILAIVEDSRSSRTAGPRPLRAPRRHDPQEDTTPMAKQLMFDERPVAR